MLINCTPHQLRLTREDGSVLVLEPSGIIPRLAPIREPCGSLDGLRVVRTTLGEPQGLPEYQGGVILVVSALVAEHPSVSHRTDLAYPGEAIRDSAGKIGWPHLDLLKTFKEAPELTERLVVFSMSDFFDYLGQQKNVAGLVVSNIEFVLAAWLAQGRPRDVKTDLCKRVELWERSPAFLLVTCDESVLANYQPTRHTGSLILKTSQTLALS